MIIPFLHSVSKEEQDKNLLQKLWSERDGIVSKAMAAARQLIDNNYIFPYCQRAVEMKNLWELSSYPGINQFIRNCCILNKSLRTYTKILHRAYAEHCLSTGFAIESENQFSRVLKDIYNLTNDRWSEDGNIALRGFRGIALQNHITDDWRY